MRGQRLLYKHVPRTASSASRDRSSPAPTTNDIQGTASSSSTFHAERSSSSNVAYALPPSPSRPKPYSPSAPSPAYFASRASTSEMRSTVEPEAQDYSLDGMLGTLHPPGKGVAPPPSSIKLDPERSWREQDPIHQQLLSITEAELLWAYFFER